MNMALNDNLLHRRPAAATTSIRRTSDLNDRRMRRRRRISKQYRSMLAAATLFSSALFLTTFIFVKRGSKPQQLDDVSTNNSQTLAQQWKPRLKKSLAANLMHNNDEISKQVHSPKHHRVNTNTNQTEELYRHKFSTQELGYDIYNCPSVPPEDYPKSWPVTDIITNWNPNDVTTLPPRHRDVYHSLCIFDYGTQLEVARVYRDKEVPFIIRNDPKVTAASKKWTTPNYLLTNLPSDKIYTERSPVNHFMFYNAGRREVHKNWIKPLNDVTAMRYDEWLERSLERDAVTLGDEELMRRVGEMRQRRLARELSSGGENEKEQGREEKAVDDADDGANHQHSDENEDQKKLNWYYWRLNAFLEQAEEEGPDKLVFEDLPFFDPRKLKESGFYLVDPTDQRGINCRFGMRGVVAESHCDLSRNMIALLEGERRYIIGHPGQCDNLYLYPRGHPSGRHASFDWSNPTNWDLHPKFRNALHSEVVMKAGDVLYLPTAWFHYIVNLSTNIQCNIRSGISYENKNALKECGFKLPSSKK